MMRDEDMRRFNESLNDLNVPEFYPGGTLAECNRILSYTERHGIESAAKSAFYDRHRAAAHFRAAAGYGDL